MPSKLTAHQMKSVGENSVGPDALANRNSINYNLAPNTFSESKILIPPHASAGTKSGAAAAAGKFVSYKGGKNISLNTNMNKDSVSFDPSKDNGNPRHHPVASAGSHKHPMKRGGKRRRTMKKRKMARKHKRHSKRHHKRSRKMHKKRAHKTRRHHKRAHKKMTRKHKRHSRRHRRMRGGMPQPFSNVPISFGYSMNTARLSPKMSALANPIPIKAYENCGKVSRS